MVMVFVVSSGASLCSSSTVIPTRYRYSSLEVESESELGLETGTGLGLGLVQGW